MKIQRLLTILDKPKHEQTALDRALAIREQCGAELELDSFCWSALADSATTLDVAQRRELKAALLRERRDWLRALLAGRGLARSQLQHLVVWTKDIAAWVAQRSAKIDASLIVKSAHPSQTLLHTPLDWSLLNTAPVPVLLVSTKRQPAARKQAKRVVLAAIDMSKNDRLHRRLNEAVLKAAHCFAELENASVHCVYALEISKVLRDLDWINERTVKARMLSESQEALHTLLAPYDVAKTRRHFPVGKPGLVVNQLARKLNARLLVVGTNAHRPARFVGLGNSAERILSRAVVSVLTVPS